MSAAPGATDTADQGATVVITHRIHPGKNAEYEDWLNEIGPVCRRAEGHVDVQIVRPIPDVTSTYTVIIRFETLAKLQHWMHSPERRQLVDRARPLLAGDDDFFIRSGLDFWFTPEGAHARVPVAWKQFLLTWSAIFPLVLLLPSVLLPMLRWLGIPADHTVDTLCLTGVVVAIMVYLVMPRYTRLVRGWLFR